VIVVIVAIAVCGAFGSIARYQLDGFIQNHTQGALPFGTLIINVIGSLILGMLVGLHLRHGLSDTIELAVGTGFCGGFTTFSSLMYESTQLAQEGAHRQAVQILSLNMVLGGFAAAIGLAVTGAL
jgi:CrcB protein